MNRLFIPNSHLVRFNPVAPTILRKSLQAVLERQKKRGWVSLPAPSSPRAKSAIDAIICTCNGDVRSAVNSLQLWLGRDSQKARKRDSDGLMKSTSQNTNIGMESAAGREASFAVFHALGKILYNKREGDPQVEPEARSSRLEVFPMKWSEPFRSESFPGGDLDSSDLHQELPAHLNHLHRRKSKVDVEVCLLILYFYDVTKKFCSNCGRICPSTQVLFKLSFTRIIHHSVMISSSAVELWRIFLILRL